MRAFYSALVGKFLQQSDEEILGALARESLALDDTQKRAWLHQILVLREQLTPLSLSQCSNATLYFEFVVPRLGRRIDVVLLAHRTIFVLEFKVGSVEFHRGAIEQVWDYALDLKNFHETSAHEKIIPILVATEALSITRSLRPNYANDGVAVPICVASKQIADVIAEALAYDQDSFDIDADAWAAGRYRPTPTIVEAAIALYADHTVEELCKSDASAQNLAVTASAIDEIIVDARAKGRKAICMVTGVPGAGKTLVGLNTATQHQSALDSLHSVYLSGNGPLVAILREALARDQVSRGKASNKPVKKGRARQAVDMFIQNVHHFRDACLDSEDPPVDHIAIFDEAQRAWTKEQTSDFMQRKKGRPGFSQSEPEFLISCLDRHKDWAVVVCLIGGGQEINTGEAGMAEWLRAIETSFPHWSIYVSSQLRDPEYGAASDLKRIASKTQINDVPELHLSTSMRSFRAEKQAHLINAILDCDVDRARSLYQEVGKRYPICLTRNVDQARQWLRKKARGSERFGMVASSRAQRLRPHAIDVRVKIDPVHWFLDDRTDVRSSFYLEDVATEFDVQGLELDWTAVVWDADLRFTQDGWSAHAFKGNKWQKTHKVERQSYLINAYRVLLTRARQGLVIVVPDGDVSDPTRAAGLYDQTYCYLKSLGLPSIGAL
ncbi:DUF2075 domain-containing protein [Variovorax sp. PCZ-1]|uniref:DUF2075 domain-containing protein n=1 Tax=Variovorax sp. PCZ-1 TaxID=2835533 RepID=UPI001BCFBEF6|nr:DUF2075 domain-containing protein [Variovorax sp. PCZ-1]MBS7808743.1 DUF2075 domain-containing protein [Variovorax sp. PCZ-1]